MTVHPTALVDRSADLADDVEVGAFAIIEAGTVIEAGVRIEPQAQVLAGTSVGADTVIGRGAIIGGLPQDLTFDPATSSGVRLGPRNVVREHVTIHRSTRRGESTTIGADNYLMVGVHLGHDSSLGDSNILANAVLVAGHVEIGSRTVIGGGAVFHQFLRIGDHAMVQGNGGFSRDIPPFVMAFRVNRIAGLNVVGLRRAGYSAEERADLKRLYNLVWRDGRNLPQAVAEARRTEWLAPARRLLEFLEAPTRKGICDNRAHE